MVILGRLSGLDTITIESRYDEYSDLRVSDVTVQATWKIE